jgi:hypothetical protein
MRHYKLPRSKEELLELLTQIYRKQIEIYGNCDPKRLDHHHQGCDGSFSNHWIPPLAEQIDPNCPPNYKAGHRLVLKTALQKSST